MLSVAIAIFLSLPASDFIATGYCLCRHRTAAGQMPRKGIVAADPKVLKLGSTIIVEYPDYNGKFIVGDTGVKGRRIDIWFESCRDARHFGRRRVKVRIL